MSGSPTSRVGGLLALAGFMLIAALASGRPELAVVAAPLLVLLAIGLAAPSRPRLSAELGLDRERLLEGERARATVTVRNLGTEATEFSLTVQATPQLGLEPEGATTVRLSPGSDITLSYDAVARRWGAHRIGPVTLRARDRLGLRSWELRLDQTAVLRAFPREQRLRQLVAPRQTQPFLGAHVARGRAEGIEFADIRPFAPGDRVRHINWRATARRSALHVTERHPERASDVVLLIDTFEEAREGAGGTLDNAVRAAASLARAHLAQRDRVALVDFGGTLHWLEPAFGTRQLYRIVDALITSQIAFSYAWRSAQSIPRRVLPPDALVLAVTPLLDERSVGLITDLRRRGTDLTVVEVSPVAHTSPGPTAADALAHRLWRLRREALRSRLQGLGIGVAVWEDSDTLGPSLEGVNAFRRSAPQLVLAR